MTEYDGLPRAPVLETDLRSVFGGDHVHVVVFRVTNRCDAFLEAQKVLALASIFASRGSNQEIRLDAPRRFCRSSRGRRE